MQPCFQQDFHYLVQPYCRQGHLLSWTKNYSCKCVRCGKSNMMSRWQCDECVDVFCVQCMRPPVAGDQCPMGHPLQKMTLNNNSCDVCRGSISGKQGYRDAACDFDLCTSCHKDFIRED